MASLIVPPFPPAAVVFDLDGLLVDSEGLWAEAEAAVLRDLGATWSADVQQRMLGRGPTEAAAILAAHVPGAPVGDVERRLLDAALARFRAGVPPRPGAMALIDALQGHLPLAVATNSRRVLAEASLASSGFAGAFAAVVAAEDVSTPKPAPDPYARACALVGRDPSESVAFEDSPVGIRSAVAAGLWVVGCPSFPDATLDGAHALVASLEDVDAAALLAGDRARARVSRAAGNAADG